MAKSPKDPSPDYNVGYRKPPKGSQYKPGQSGNPKGRSKGRPTASDIFTRESARLVRIQVGENIESVSKLEAVFRKTFSSAINGDPRATQLIFAAEQRFASNTELNSEEAYDRALASNIPSEDAIRRMVGRFDRLKSEESDD